MLTFTAENHQYMWNGNIVKSVTQILAEWVKVKMSGFEYYVHTQKGTVIPAYIFEAAADHGTAVHKIFELVMSGEGVEESALNSDLIIPMEQIKAFKAKYQPKTIIMERPLYCKEFNFAGTPDWFGILNRIKNRVLLDVKTGGYDLVAEQLAAYEKPVREETGYRGMIDHYCLFIPKDGSDCQFFKVNQKGAWKRFQARMIINN